MVDLFLILWYIILVTREQYLIEREEIKMRYCIYTRNQNKEFESINVTSATERDLYLSRLKTEFKNDLLAVCYCPIYKCGEYGQLVPVIGNALDAL